MVRELNPLDEDFANPVGPTPRTTETYLAEQAAAKEQSWYNTLGIGGDENTETFAAGVKDSFVSGGNFAFNIWEDISRMYDNTPDPNFNARDFITQNEKRLGISLDYYPAYANTRSMGEAMDLHRDIQEREAARKRLGRMGITGQLAAGAIAGIADIDTLASGGFALIGKSGLMATKMGQIMSGTAAGTGAALLGAAASPEDDWADVGIAAVMSAGVSTATVGLSRNINKSLDDTLTDIDKAVTDRAAKQDIPAPEANTERFAHSEVQPVKAPEGAEAPEVVPDTPTPDSAASAGVDRHMDQEGSSAGAAQVQKNTIDVTLNDATAEEVQRFAADINKKHKLDVRYEDEFAPALEGNAVQSTVAKNANRVTKVINKLGMSADFDRFMNSGSPAARALAYLGMRDPAARLNNNANAASYHQTFTQELMGTFYDGYISEQKAWVKRNTTKNYGFTTPAQRREARRKFNQQVYIEQENMRLDGAYSTGIDPSVKRVAEILDETHLREHRIAVGDGVSTDVKGWTEFDPYKGYAGRPLDTSRVYGDIRRSKIEFNAGRANKVLTERDFEDMWAGYYGDPRTGLSGKDARNVAKMVMGYARDSDQGMFTDLNSLYNRASTDAFFTMANNVGITKAEANSLAKKIEKYSEKRAQQNQTKSRIDGDIRYQHSNGLRVMDYINTDLEQTMPNRLRRTAGLAALARGAGIRSPEDMRAWKTAILNEQASIAEDVVPLTDGLAGVKDAVNRRSHVTSDDIDGIFAQFTGAVVKGDTMAGYVMRGKRWASMSALGSTGLWQVAETSNLVGAAGWGEFVKQLPAAVKSDLTNPRSALVQELRQLGRFIPEEKLTNPYYVGDLNESLSSQSNFMYWLDRAGARGANAQGLLSGMFKVREIQHNLSTFIAVDKLFRGIAGKDAAFSETRLLQMGADKDFIADLKAVHAKDVIEWDGDNVKRLNIDQWRNGDLEYRLMNTLNTFTDQQVQKAIAGETNSLFAGNGVASIFTQFLSYPMLAVNKQMARQAYAGDTEALMTAMYGFLFGGMIGMAKVTMNGKFEELDLETFAKSGFQNGNLTGWLPTMADPLIALFGGGDDGFGRSSGVLRDPPAISVLNSVSKAPSSAVKLMFGDNSNKNVNNLRIIPVLGNHPLWVGMLGAIKAIGDGE